jgi:hypothetical protein
MVTVVAEKEVEISMVVMVVVLLVLEWVLVEQVVG